MINEVAADFAAAVAFGRLDLPLPGSGRTWERWAVLADLAGEDLSVARLSEGHADALAILAELGAGAPPAGSRWGVWAAQPVAGQAGLTVITDPCLIDRDYGPWTGAPKESVAGRWGSVDNAPGVEPVLVILVRAMTGLNAIAGRCRDGAVVAVSHDAVNRQVLAALCPDLGDHDSIPQDNGCFNTLERRDEKWT